MRVIITVTLFTFLRRTTENFINLLITEMVFLCQTDSFLKEYRCKVLSCEASIITSTINGKETVIKGYEVILEDTIMFPEGGGQPCDQGFLNDVKVLQVTRKGSDAIHFVTEPLEPGTSVVQRLDWERRHDHMQQHSGQHLISALGENIFNYTTTSWWLGSETSFIELDAPSLNQSEVDEWEKIANEKIQEALPVTITLYEPNDPMITEAQTRGLPDDHEGPIRVVNINGIDSNMCCGTHVKSLSELQSIKLLYFERGKQNKINLHFLVGNRILKQLNLMMKREKALTFLLKSGPAEHLDLVDKLQKQVKLNTKRISSVLRDLAVHEARTLLLINPLPKWYSLHRSEGDSDFIRVFINTVGREDILLFVTVGEDNGSGHMVMSGCPEVISLLGPKICKIMEGKGVIKGSQFQAKVSALSKRNQAETIIDSYFFITE